MNENQQERERGRQTGRIIGRDAPDESKERHAEIAVEVMTGNPDRILEFDAAGQPYLSKPFTVELFLQRVQELVGPPS